MKVKESCKQLVVQLDKELSAWLESKAAEGYKKSSLVRAILHKEMESDGLGTVGEGEEPETGTEEEEGYETEGDEDED